MNLVDITGGTVLQRRAVEAAVNFAIQEMMPRMRTLDIEVKLVNIKSDAVGYCLEGDTNREFEIEVDKKQGLLALVSTVLHEMVHVKQYARREIDGYNMAWKRVPIPEGTPYAELPWEIEAYRMQDELLIKMVDNDLF